MHYIAVSDREAGKARDLAEKVGAQFHSGDNREVISRPEVNAVIVSTSEGEHMDAVLQAVALGKPVLVEKPIALTLADADAMVAAIDKAGANVRVGYSRRYKERYLIAKEQIVQGRLGKVVGAAARVYNSRSQGLAVLKRDGTTESIDAALTTFKERDRVVGLDAWQSIEREYLASGGGK